MKRNETNQVIIGKRGFLYGSKTQGNIMVGIALSYTTIGIDAQQISVEADNSNALYGVNIVGMASSAVKESKDRIFAALKNSGYSSYDKRYTINLAPAGWGTIAKLALWASFLWMAMYVPFPGFCPLP